MVTRKSSVWTEGYPPTTSPAEPLDEGPIRDIHDSIPISLLGKNWLPPPHLWSAGASAKPDYYRALGSSVAVARDTTDFKMPGFGGIPQSCKITADSGDIGALEHRFIQSGSAGHFGFLAGMQFSVAIPVLTTDVDVVELIIDDGDETTTSVAHSGSPTGGVDGDGWEWLKAVHTISSAWTELKCRVEGPADAVFNVDAGVAGLGPIPPAAWQPIPTVPARLPWVWAGVVATGDGALDVQHTLDRPGLAMAWYLRAKTGPSSADLDAQFKKGGATDLFTTAPSIADGQTVGEGGGVAGDYLARCLGRRQYVELDIDAVAGAAGLNAQLVVVHPWRPHEYLLDYDEVD
jgi:hypothetical protein